MFLVFLFPNTFSVWACGYIGRGVHLGTGHPWFFLLSSNNLAFPLGTCSGWGDSFPWALCTVTLTQDTDPTPFPQVSFQECLQIKWLGCRLRVLLHAHTQCPIRITFLLCSKGLQCYQPISKLLVSRSSALWLQICQHKQVSKGFQCISPKGTSNKDGWNFSDHFGYRKYSL